MRVNVISMLDLVGGVRSAHKNIIASLNDLGVETIKNKFFSEFDIADIYMPDPMGYLFVLKSKLCRKPVVIRAHGFFGDLKNSFNMSENSNFFISLYLKNFYKSADFIVTPTEFSRKELLRLGLSDSPIEVISNGVDTKRFKYNRESRIFFRRKFEIDKNKIVVYGVGHTLLRKGIETFAYAARKFPECEFIWAGPIYPKMLAGQKALVELLKTPPKNLHFLGFSDNIFDIHCGADIFLFPSYYETEGLAVLEAASCGRPLVLRNLEVYDRFRHGKECFKCNNDREFENAIEKLTASKKLRHKMGMLARKSVLDIDVRKVAKKTLRVYESVLGPKRRGA